MDPKPPEAPFVSGLGISILAVQVNMKVEEIKIRQLTNQHLTAPADRKTVIRDICGVQAQFMSNAMHALRIRCNDHSDEYTLGLIKNWTIRGTLHVFSEDDLSLFLHSGRKHYLRPCDTLNADEFISQERKSFFADFILRKIAEGADTRDELKKLCFEQGMTDREAKSVFDPWGGTIRALCENGSIGYKAQEKKAFFLCPPFSPMDAETARLELARRYFTRFAPATIKDAAYFFGTTQTEVKKWLDQLPVTAVDCNAKTYYYIDTGIDYRTDIPRCVFLAGFDQLMLGYQKTESLYLPTEHLRGIFNLAGIVMPSILLTEESLESGIKKGERSRSPYLNPSVPMIKSISGIAPCAFGLRCAV